MLYIKYVFYTSGTISQKERNMPKNSLVTGIEEFVKALEKADTTKIDKGYNSSESALIFLKNELKRLCEEFRNKTENIENPEVKEAMYNNTLLEFAEQCAAVFQEYSPRLVKINESSNKFGTAFASIQDKIENFSNQHSNIKSGLKKMGFTGKPAFQEANPHMVAFFKNVKNAVQMAQSGKEKEIEIPKLTL